MKLWHLVPTAPDGMKMHPRWVPWYDKAFGFVVRAETEEQARQIAASDAGDEGKQAWLDVSASTCVELLSAGTAGIVIKDFASA